MFKLANRMNAYAHMYPCNLEKGGDKKTPGKEWAMCHLCENRRSSVH